MCTLALVARFNVNESSAPVDELSLLPQELSVGCIFTKIDTESLFAL
jgi:hypothetical protein